MVGDQEGVRRETQRQISCKCCVGAGKHVFVADDFNVQSTPVAVEIWNILGIGYLSRSIGYLEEQEDENS